MVLEYESGGELYDEIVKKSRLPLEVSLFLLIPSYYIILYSNYSFFFFFKKKNIYIYFN